MDSEYAFGRQSRRLRSSRHGKGTAVGPVEVRGPGGRRQIYQEVPINQVAEIVVEIDELRGSSVR